MATQTAHTEEIIHRMQQAAAANLATPGRQAGIVTITPEMADEVMITGDLHGHRKNFAQIGKLADLTAHPRRHLVMQEVLHGGPSYENGGCMSHSMLEDVAKLKLEFPDRLHFLLSNHEVSELTDYPIRKGGALLNLVFRLGLEHTYGPASDRVLEAYRAFIRSCPLAVRLPGGAFVSHSVPEATHRYKFDLDVLSRELSASDFGPHGAAFELVWGRDYSEENAQAFAALVGATVLLNGHEPCDDGYATPNSVQVIFDCCRDNACYAILPTNVPLDQHEVVARVQKL